MILYCSLDARQIAGGKKAQRHKDQKDFKDFFVIFVPFWLKILQVYQDRGVHQTAREIVPAADYDLGFLEDSKL